MGNGKGDQAKGKVKQAVGDLTGDNDLKSDGKVDEKAGKAKAKIGGAVDAVKNKLNKK
jgi:uncharacterized protein YjbJ (UPF0337 family)